MSEQSPGARAFRRSDPLLSTRAGELVIQEYLGAERIGVIYRAAHPETGRQAAVTVLFAEMTQTQPERFLAEARVLGALRHPGIIEVLDAGTLPDGRCYFATELVRGRTLGQVLSWHSQLYLPVAAGILDQVLYVLEAVHGVGAVHGYLVPYSISLAEGADGLCSVKLTDFPFFTKILADHSDASYRIPRPRIDALAPEQLLGNEVSPATDLYGVGTLAVRLLTGKRLFDSESDFENLEAIRNAPPPAPSSRVPELPRELDALVLQLLAKEPGQRPESARAVREALRRIPGTALPELPARQAEGVWPPMARFAPFPKPPPPPRLSSPLQVVIRPQPPPAPSPPKSRSGLLGWVFAVAALGVWGGREVGSCAREKVSVAPAVPGTAPSPAAQEMARLWRLQHAQTDEIDLARLALRDREGRGPEDAKAHEALGRLRLRASRAVTEPEREAIRQGLGEWKRVYLGTE